MIILPSMAGIRGKVMGLPAGQIFWLDASQQNKIFTDAGVTNVLNNNDLIYQWNDISSSAKNAIQATSTLRPQWKNSANGINNLSTTNFYNTASYPYWTFLKTSANIGFGTNSPRTCFTVQKEYNPGGSPACVVSWGASTSTGFWSHLFLNGNVGLSINGSTYALELSVAASVGSMSVLTSQLYLGPFSSYYPRFRKNSGSWNNSSNVISTPNSVITVGAGTSTGTNFLGPICEIIIYNKNLSDSECLTVENYLKAKWGF